MVSAPLSWIINVGMKALFKMECFTEMEPFRGLKMSHIKVTFLWERFVALILILGASELICFVLDEWQGCI